MGIYFNVNLEFDHRFFHKTIKYYADNHLKGYVCVVDGNVLTMAQKNKEYLNILNSSIINTCDGSSVAMIAGFIQKQPYRALTGPEIFSKYIEDCNYKQLLLGSSNDITNKIKETLLLKKIDSKHLHFLPLPILSVSQFDYKIIAKQINEIKPSIIWVSLGAPKQEIFMSNITPLLEQGVLFGIGAAFNFYIDIIKLPKYKIGHLKLIWLSRFIAEPRKLFCRIIKFVLIIPKLYISERKNAKKLFNTKVINK